MKPRCATFDNPNYVDRLFSHLYQKLVRYTDNKVRTGLRLDYCAYGDGSEGDDHPLMNHLAAAKEGQPLEILLALEDAAEQLAEPERHDTRASAYLYLLRLYNNNMKAVADHLMISLSYCYYRFNEALVMVKRQCALPDTIGRSDGNFVPGPWRSFRLARPAVQLEFDFWPVVDLWGQNGIG